ncbi:hypothetical protein E1757_33130 [Paenibacillus piri]|uniref:Ldh family oxidoreductase n=1 Tax=Paenibacillus piri TaxID=2547395 RepID=A0A4R5K8I5_9BACL|nr:hypothetical protein E1757_33130 [Paenibacillus piri]
MLPDQADIRIAHGSPTTASVDGDNGLGFIVAHKAMSESIRMAKQFGTGWTTVYNSNHCGAGAYYTLMAARQNMIGLLFSTGGSTVAGPGGKERMIGNNVMAFAPPVTKKGRSCLIWRRRRRSRISCICCRMRGKACRKAGPSIPKVGRLPTRTSILPRRELCFH